MFQGDDSVTECYRDGSNVVARESYNDNKRNVRTQQLQRNRYEGSYSEGLTSCHWTRNYQSESFGNRYDLENNSYYVLLAKGAMSDGGKILVTSEGNLRTKSNLKLCCFDYIPLSQWDD